MTVNPKKMRPYDVPPKRRRPRIPEGPDSAATGFLVAAALWVAAATGIATLAVGLMIFPELELAVPLGVFELEFVLNPRRVEYAFVNATVYGWLGNAGFAAIAFITARVLGRQMAREKLLNVGLGIWNLSVAGGIGALYIFDPGPHAALTAFPWFITGGMALALLIVAVSFASTVGRGLRQAYVSTWFAAAALLALLGIVGTSALVGTLQAFGLFTLPELETALASAYLHRSVETFWIIGMTAATLHYVVPRATGNPLASGGLAFLSFVTWLVLAPLSGLGVLLDESVPYVITSLGGAATMLLLVPAFLAATNLLLTLRGRWTLTLGVGTAAFALVAISFWLAAALLEAIGALRSVEARVGGTVWEMGAFVFLALGAGTFAMFALGDFAAPRLLRRAWRGGLLAEARLWAGFAGATIAGLALIGGGLAQGALLAQAAGPDAISSAMLPYLGGAAAGFGLVALAGLATLVDLFLMYTSGEPVVAVAPSGTAAAPAGH